MPWDGMEAGGYLHGEARDALFNCGGVQDVVVVVVVVVAIDTQSVLCGWWLRCCRG